MEFVFTWRLFTLKFIIYTYVPLITVFDIFIKNKRERMSSVNVFSLLERHDESEDEETVQRRKEAIRRQEEKRKEVL